MLHEEIRLPGTGAKMDIYCPDKAESDNSCEPHAGIVICGGGAYEYVSDRETVPVALRFAAMGFNTYAVYYRVAPDRFPCGVQDVAEAVAWIRENAGRYGQHPDRIAAAGFSAGGHVACSLGVMWQRAELWQVLSRNPEEVRPNAMVLCYPVITAGRYAHRRSFENLTGSEDMHVHSQYSLEQLVSAQTPPTFLWTTWDDSAVPCQNTLCFANALCENGIPAEVHIYPHGVHGLSLADRTTWCSDPAMLEPTVAGWPELAARFLHTVFN